jgi:hypothetical protein
MREVCMFFLLSSSDATAVPDSNVYQRELNASILAARDYFRSSERRWSHLDEAAITAQGFVWREGMERKHVSRIDITGWALSLVGIAIWLYGYLSSGHAALLDWPAYSPWWIADFLPNVESEVGMILMLAGAGASYWPKSNDAET